MADGLVEGSCHPARYFEVEYGAKTAGNHLERVQVEAQDHDAALQAARPDVLRDQLSQSRVGARSFVLGSNLDLEQELSTTPVAFEHVVEGRHALGLVPAVQPTARIERPDLVPLALADGMSAATNLVQRAVVVNDRDAVTGELQVQLDPVAPLVERGVERRYRVFGTACGSAAMRDDPWQAAGGDTRHADYPTAALGCASGRGRTVVYWKLACSTSHASNSACVCECNAARIL